jgi:hypothetical protein
MFRAAHRLSSGAQTVFAAPGLYMNVVAGRCHSALTTACHHMCIQGVPGGMCQTSGEFS